VLEAGLIGVGALPLATGLGAVVVGLFGRTGAVALLGGAVWTRASADGVTVGGGAEAGAGATAALGSGVAAAGSGAAALGWGAAALGSSAVALPAGGAVPWLGLSGLAATTSGTAGSPSFSARWAIQRAATTSIATPSKAIPAAIGARRGFGGSEVVATPVEASVSRTRCEPERCSGDGGVPSADSVLMSAGDSSGDDGELGRAPGEDGGLGRAPGEDGGLESRAGEDDGPWCMPA
jgi:hypothetical protein